MGEMDRFHVQMIGNVAWLDQGWLRRMTDDVAVCVADQPRIFAMGNRRGMVTVTVP